MTAQSVCQTASYIQNTNVETTRFDDEWILLNLDQYTVTKINKTGAYLWSLLREEQTVDSLYEVVVAEYGFDSSNKIAKLMIEDFLSELLEYEVIQIVDCEGNGTYHSKCGQKDGMDRASG